MSTPRSHYFRIVAACFEGLPEGDLLTEAAEGLAEMQFVRSRFKVAASVSRTRPAMVIMPTADAAGVPSAVLAARCIAAVPDVLVVLVATRKVGAARAIPEALRSGGILVSVSSARELRQIIAGGLGQVSMSSAELSQVYLVLDCIESPLLKTALCEATQFAHERLTVEDLAARVELHPVVLRRQLRHAGQLTGREIILWGRLIRVSVASWRNEASLLPLARAAGFANAGALRRACATLLGLRRISREQLLPASVAAALRDRLRPHRPPSA